LLAAETLADGGETAKEALVVGKISFGRVDEGVGGLEWLAACDAEAELDGTASEEEEAVAVVEVVAEEAEAVDNWLIDAIACMGACLPPPPLSAAEDERGGSLCRSP
jgi:hypothetical protein